MRRRREPRVAILVYAPQGVIEDVMVVPPRRHPHRIDPPFLSREITEKARKRLSRNLCERPDPGPIQIAPIPTIAECDPDLSLFSEFEIDDHVSWNDILSIEPFEV
jgi:hypothetical protein